MTKEEASRVLGMSVRAVERAVANKKLHPNKVSKPNGGFRLDFAAEDVERFKAERDALGVQILPRESPGTFAQRDANAAQLATLFDRLATAMETLAAQRDAPGELATTLPMGGGVSLVDIATKPLLTLAEAAQLTGISERKLSELCRAHKLPAIAPGYIARGWRIRRSDLDRFIGQLKPEPPRAKRRRA